MRKMLPISLFAFSMLCALFPVYCLASADRAEVEARVRADVAKDLKTSWQPVYPAPRTCLDGRPVADFSGAVAEYWVNLECPYCGIVEPMQAQRQNADVCIVVRHVPTR